MKEHHGCEEDEKGYLPFDAKENVSYAAHLDTWDTYAVE